MGLFAGMIKLEDIGVWSISELGGFAATGIDETP